MDNGNLSNNLQIIFDANSNVHYSSEQPDNTQSQPTVTIAQPQQQQQQHETSETEETMKKVEGEGEGDDSSRKFRGVNWDDYSTQHLLDIYQCKFPLLESTPHNKGRKQIYEEIRNEFNSDEKIHNKRTLKSITRKWGEMLAKYRIRRGMEDETGKPPDAHWGYQDRMHDIVGHLPINGRVVFPITNTVVDPKTNQLTTTTVTELSATLSTITAPIIVTGNKRNSNSNSRKRTRPDVNDINIKNHLYDNNPDNKDNVVEEVNETKKCRLPCANLHSISLQSRPLQPKAAIQSTLSSSQQPQQQSSSPSSALPSSSSSNQAQVTTMPSSRALKIPRKLEPKRNAVTKNSDNYEKDKTIASTLVSPSLPPSSTPLHEHGHDIRNTTDQILESGKRLNELKAAESSSTEKAISDSLRVIAESSKHMVESNKLLAQQIENNTKITAALLEAMNALVETMINRHLDGGRS